MQTTTHKNKYTFPDEIKKWLHDRTLSDETLERFDIHWNGNEIVIPIKDNEGTFLFNKYRRNPLQQEGGPKYRYERGATSVLYNSQTLENAHQDEPVFIVEGELDALALENIGIKAVSSTGGAGTFSKEWIDHFVDLNNLVICFDSDTAGIRGAMNAQSLLPHAFMLFLPEGMDVTDFLVEFDKKELLSLKAEKYTVPQELEDFLDKKEVRKKTNEFKDACNEIMVKKQEMMQNRMYTAPLDIIRTYLVDRYEHYRRTQKSAQRQPYTGDSSNVLTAKEYPITSLINFNRAGYHPCIWHSEKTASMYYNKPGSKFPNTVKCFGCGAMGDPVDVVMEMQGVDFNEAVKQLTSNQ